MHATITSSRLFSLYAKTLHLSSSDSLLLNVTLPVKSWQQSKNSSQYTLTLIANILCIFLCTSSMDIIRFISNFQNT